MFQSNTVTLNHINHRFALIHVDLMFDVKSTHFRVKSTQIDVRGRPGSTKSDRASIWRRLGVDRRRFTSIEVDLGFINVVLS